MSEICDDGLVWFSTRFVVVDLFKFHCIHRRRSQRIKWPAATHFLRERFDLFGKRQSREWECSLDRKHKQNEHFNGCRDCPIDIAGQPGDQAQDV
jgi:hypothetical protein